MTIHVFPVPFGYTPEDAWAELTWMGRFVEYRWWKPQYRWPLKRWGMMVEVTE